MSSAFYNKILIVNPFGIGDAVFSMYLAESLKKQLPQTQVGFLGNERTIELLRMDSSIDVCFEFNRDEFRALRRKSVLGYLSKIMDLSSSIKKEGFGCALDLSLGREFSFVAACLGIPKRIGFDYKNRGFWLTAKTPFEGYEGKHVVDWQLGLLRAAGLGPLKLPAKLPLIISPAAKKEARDFLAKSGVKEGAVFFAVAPGGGKSWGSNAAYKQWAPERFAQAAERGPRAGETILLLGDADERQLLENVKKEIASPALVAAGLGLGAVCELLRHSRVLLCNDGGLLHLANALGVSTVSIYGPVDEKVYGPYGEGVRREVLTQEVPCRPCYHQFRFPPCGHQRRCLEELSVEKVSAALQKI